LTVPPSAVNEVLPPLFCRSESRFVKKDCRAAVPELAAVVVPAVDAAVVVEAGVDAVAAVVEDGELAAVLPPSALINCVKAVLSVEIAFDDRLEPVVLVTI
jgi:hypothetical protein